MKQFTLTISTTLIVLLTFYSPGTSAQLHNLYADIGSAPGFSLSYNYQSVKRWGFGGGIQGYSIYPTLTRKFTPALFGQVRLNIRPLKKSQFFSFLDMGINIYKQGYEYYRGRDAVYHIPHNNGFYAGLGIGYFRKMTKNGGGPYVSLKMASNWFTEREYSLLSSEQDRVLTSASGTVIISAGFKFGYKPAKWEQEEYSTDKKKKKWKKETVRLDRGPLFYITTSTGFNNSTGVLGLNLELPLSARSTADAGAGFGTWGSKFFIGVKHYLKPAQRGFAFGGGLTYATGAGEYNYNITTIHGRDTTARVRENAQTNIFLSAYKYWNLGKQYNRLFAQLGWSVPLTEHGSFIQLTGDPMDKDSEYGIRTFAPSGPVIAVGFSFGIHSKHKQ